MWRVCCTTGLRKSAKNVGRVMVPCSKIENKLSNTFSVCELLAGESTIANGMCKNPSLSFSLVYFFFSGVWSKIVLMAVR